MLPSSCPRVSSSTSSRAASLERSQVEPGCRFHNLLVLASTKPRLQHLCLKADLCECQEKGTAFAGSAAARAVSHRRRISLHGSGASRLRSQAGASL